MPAARCRGIRLTSEMDASNCATFAMASAAVAENPVRRPSCVSDRSGVSCWENRTPAVSFAVPSVIRDCALSLVILAAWAEPVAARSYLKCMAKKVIITHAPTGSTSSSSEESLGFWIDASSKTVVLADGTRLVVRRIDNIWISAARAAI